MIELGGNRAVRFGEFMLDSGEERVIGPAGEVRIGRKALHLLGALIQRPGALLTKDALFETVWDGTVVSESALTATIKELRRALGDEARNPRFIESVYGRGYRFIAPVVPAAAGAIPTAPTVSPNLAQGTRVADPAPALPAATERRSGISRRALLGWGIAGAAAAAGAAVIVRSRRRPEEPSPEVAAMMAHARQLMGSNVSLGQNEAVGLLRRVVVLAPRFADGWGMLGLAYAIKSHYRDPREQPALREHARAAADRALELGPGNAYGELARGLELRFIGHWLERDRYFDRALLARPDDYDVLTFVAVNLQFNGRASAALPYYERIRQRPLTPGDTSDSIHALWSAGRIDEAERAADDAGALYPTQQTLWYDRWRIMTAEGRPAAAVALLDDPAAKPLNVGPDMLADLRAQAEAVRDPASPQARRTLARVLADARIGSFEAEAAVRLASLLGDRDAAFEVADALYFSRGFAVPDHPSWGSTASLDDRDTRLLFERETAPLRADPRFERLVEEIGLDRYWRARGVVPDYRRGRPRSV